MPLYKITRTDVENYDEYDALVIRTASPERALEIACMTTTHTRTYNDGRVRAWDDPDYEGMTLATTVVALVETDGPEEVVCSSFNAG
jgi:hypothetical protein